MKKSILDYLKKIKRFLFCKHEELHFVCNLENEKQAYDRFTISYGSVWKCRRCGESVLIEGKHKGENWQ